MDIGAQGYGTYVSLPASCVRRFPWSAYPADGGFPWSAYPAAGGTYHSIYIPYLIPTGYPQPHTAYEDWSDPKYIKAQIILYIYTHFMI